jgi:PleD family two-component response regulator
LFVSSHACRTCSRCDADGLATPIVEWSGEALRILLVEHEQLVWEMLEGSLQDSGFAVEKVSTGEQAIDASRSS